MSTARRTDWPTLALLCAMYLLFVGNLVLYWTAPLHFAFHFCISVVAIHLAFTIWHEAAHQTVSGSKRVNDVVGVLGMFPYMTPFFMQKYIHMQHHRYMNERRDPNFIYTDGPFLTIPFRYLRALRYAGEVLSADPRSAGARLSDRLTGVALLAIFGIGIWLGVGLDLVLLWLLPLAVAKLIMDWYINYVPHVGLPPNRFGGTRILDVRWLTPLVLCHNYHAIHHLWPDHPWHQYTRIFRDRHDYLEEHGVPIESSVFAKRSLSAPIEH